MVEGQPRGVQELALEPEHARRAVLGVPAHRVPDRAQVDADLVRAPGLQAQPQQRGLSRSARSSAKWVRASRGAGRRRSPCACARAGRGRSAPRSCPCAPADAPPRAPGTRVRSAARRGRLRSSRWASSRARDDEQAGGVAVEPVHDPGPRGVPAGRRRRALARGDSGASMLGERVLAVAARGVHDEARALVDHEQVLVLVGDREGGSGSPADGGSLVGRRSPLPAALALDHEEQDHEPSVIEASARLNGGQPSGSLTKSVTEPWRTRSSDVAERAAEQHAGRQPDQRRGWRGARSRRAGRAARGRSGPSRSRGCRAGSRRRRRGCACSRGGRPGRSLRSSPGAIERSTACLLSWSAATHEPSTDQRPRASHAAAGRESGRARASAAQPWMMPATTMLLTICRVMIARSG